MKICHRPIIALVASSFTAALWAAGISGPPGVVIDTTPTPETEYVGSPSIAILSDGSYVASHDFFGKQGAELGTTRVFGSRDRGASWTQMAQLPEATWGTLFVHRGALYLISITHEYGDVALRRSRDGGRTWTAPADAQHGLLFKGRFHCAPVPVVVQGGRIWRGRTSISRQKQTPTTGRSMSSP